MTTVIVDIQAKSVEDVMLLLGRKLASPALGGWMREGVEPILQKRATDRFGREGDDASGRWAQLSDATVEIRAGLGFGGAHPINLRTGELENLITQGNGTIEAGEDSVTLTYPGNDQVNGELEDKIRHAQLGGISDAGNTYPARPVLAVSSTDLGQVEISLIEYIFGG